VPVLSTAQASLTGAPASLSTTGTFPTGVDIPLLLEDGQDNGASAVGTAAAGARTMTLGSLAAMPEAGLGPTIDALFNLLTVTRGKTVASEVLGSGNAAVGGQDFTLQKSPVTYFVDPASLSGDRFSSTVRVWVNQLRWSEVPSFFGELADAQVFVTREDEDGKTHVMFGDGVNGARLPSGVNNVVASYRFGSGAASPSPGTLTNIMQPQPGLKSLRNPIAPTGGADPDPPSRIRTLAPRSVLTFGRAISLDDYQVIAATTPGVIQATASYGFDAVAQRPGVAIWVSGDAGCVAAVQAAIATAADPNRPVTVLPATGIDTVVRLTYVRDARYLDDVAAAALYAALLDPDSGLFGVNRVGIGEAFYDSQVYETCLDVPGVVAVEDLSVRVGNQFVLLAASFHRFRRGRFPIHKVRPCTGHRHDPGQGNYLSVPDDGAHLLLTGRQAS
jgi:predicted phage baseplate assembly protein